MKIFEQHWTSLSKEVEAGLLAAVWRKDWRKGTTPGRGGVMEISRNVEALRMREVERLERC